MRISDWSSDVCSSDLASYRKRFDELGITLIAERGELLGNGRVRAGGQELSAAHVLIATGGHARRPDITGNEHGIDSNGFFDLCAAPRKVAVIGDRKSTRLNSSH